MPAPVLIAIVSWNTQELLRQCLSSIAPEHAAGRARVIVIDNGSTDGSALMAEREFPWAQTIASPRNLGFGQAVNLVAGHARDAEWIAAANADIALTPGSLQRLLSAGADHPDSAIIAPRLVGERGETQHSIHPFPTLALTLAFNLGIAQPFGDRLAIEGRWNPERARHVDWALGAFLLIRRTAFDQLGGFDPDQWMYAEDLDLGWRAAQLGWRTWYEPSARISHVGAAATVQAWGHEARERWLRSTYGWMVRRRGAPVARAYAALNTAGALARSRDPEMRVWARLHGRALLTRTAELQRHA